MKIPSLLLVLMLLPFVIYAAVDAGYEANNGVSGTCSVNYDKPDAYGGGSNNGFGACNCTSYVAYRLRLNNVKLDGELFVNWNWGNTNIHWSNAYFWNDADRAGAAGVREDQYPAVGAVAHWEHTTAKKDDDGKEDVGHVAYVQKIYTNEVTGRIVSFDVMEYNWPADHLYHYRNIQLGGGGYPSSFLHFEEKGRDADNTNVTCVTGISMVPPGSHAGTFCWTHRSNTDTGCSTASGYYYFDYQGCQRYTVNSGYCASVRNNRGYVAHLGNRFPESIDPTQLGHGFATCGSTGTNGYGGTPGRVDMGPLREFLNR